NGGWDAGISERMDRSCSRSELRLDDQSMRALLARAKGAAPAAPQAPIGTASLLAPDQLTTTPQIQGSQKSVYYDEVKRRVAVHWHPKRIELQQPKDSYRTILRVDLRPDGTMARNDIQASSGVEAFDQEAVSAFTAAQPLPKPPADL